MLNTWYQHWINPFFFVRGNHARVIEHSDIGTRNAPQGAIDMHNQVLNYKGVLMAGVEGSVRYKPGPFQYSQQEMWRNVFRLVPGLIRNRLRFGRYLDIFISHAPPRGINDREDLPHQGIEAFRWLLEVFRPRYHLHGHIHLYGLEVVRVVNYHQTEVINTYGYRNNLLYLPHFQVVDEI
jgi:uncharacterized protein